MNEKLCILFEIALKFLPNGSIDNNQALVWIMAWRRIGHTTLSEPMLARYTDAKCNAPYQHLLDADININLETLPMCCSYGCLLLKRFKETGPIMCDGWVNVVCLCGVGVSILYCKYTSLEKFTLTLRKWWTNYQTIYIGISICISFMILQQLSTHNEKCISKLSCKQQTVKSCLRIRV